VDVGPVLRGGAVRLGRDHEGLPHLLIPLPDARRGEVLKRTGGLTLTVRPLVLDGTPQTFVDLACLRTDLLHVFVSLAVDLRGRLEAGREPVGTVMESVAQWQSLFALGAMQWTRNKCAGLFAELTVLGRLLAIDPHAIGTWCGPLGAAQDFRGHRHAVEVKSTPGGEGRLIRVHGTDQLEVPARGDLLLAWFRLVEGDRTQGRSVRSTLEGVTRNCSDGRHLATCLAALALPPPPHPFLDDQVFSVAEERWLRVDEDFPRIVPSSFTTGAIPGGIAAVEYLVDLDVVPAAAVVTDPSHILRQMVAER
jgi:hypothetical protein